LGLNQGALELYAPLLSLFAVFMHANVSWELGPISYLVATPQFHRWHHSTEPTALNKNFCGMFPVFDWMFGTLYFPRGVTPGEYGLVGAPVPEGFWGHMTHPFWPRSDAASLIVENEEEYGMKTGQLPVRRKAVIGCAILPET